MENYSNVFKPYIPIKLVLFFLSHMIYAQIPATGLVGYYPFNEDVTDKSSFQTHGENFGATPTNDRFGQENKAYQFNGIDQYIEVPDSNQFSISETGSLTVSVWMRCDVLDFPNNENDYIHWLGKGISSQQEWHLRMYNLNSIRPNRTSCYVFNLTGGLGSGSYVQESVNVGEWIHIVAVYDYPSNNIKLYKNGELKDTDFFTDYNITPENGTAPLRIGTRDFASYFKGAIDDLRFYNRVLTAAEVDELYNEESDVLSVNNEFFVKSELIRTYPNPTEEILMIAYDKNIKEVQIINSLGSLIFSKNNNSNTIEKRGIDVSNFTSGLYFLIVQTTEGKETIKFVKK